MNSFYYYTPVDRKVLSESIEDGRLINQIQLTFVESWPEQIDRKSLYWKTLTNAFSIVGTIMGIKYATQEGGKK